jgi:hypothetical protein
LAMGGLGIDTRFASAPIREPPEDFSAFPQVTASSFLDLGHPRESMIRSMGNKRRRVEVDHIPHLGIEMWGTRRAELSYLRVSNYRLLT